MKIEKLGKKIIIELETEQSSYDALDEYVGEVPNLVGVIVNGDNGDFEQGIYKLNDLGYKDDIQLGAPILMTYMEDEEFRKLCEKLDLDVWEYEKCAKCRTTLYGSFTLGKEGNICSVECEKKEKN